MRDAPLPTPALAGKPAVRTASVTVEALPEGHVLQVLGAATPEPVRAALAAAGVADSDVRPAGYRTWFAVGDRPLPGAALRAFAAALPEGVHVSDQSHGRVRIRVAGPGAAEMLARGTAVDLDPAAFPAGSGAATLFNHVALHLARTGDDGFEATVPRSFALALFEELEALARAV